MTASKDSAPLGQFIRAHRERLSPEQAGLPPGQRRRAKGLRREEVAALCDISTTWLTWIEQGRTQSVSAPTLARLAEALRLTAAERDYLFNLAGLKDPEPEWRGPSEQAKALLKQATAHIDSPAYVLDAEWRAVAWNPPAQRLFRDWLGRPDTSRSLLDFIFLAPEARSFIDQWAERAGRIVAELRADLSPRLNQPAVAAMIAALEATSPEFRQYWQQQDVQGREGGSRVFHHPSAGRIEHQQITLKLAQAPEYKLVMLL